MLAGSNKDCEEARERILADRIIEAEHVGFYRSGVVLPEGVDLWEDPDVVELEIDIREHGIFGNVNFEPVKKELPGMDKDSTAIRAVLLHKPTGLEIVVKQQGAYLDTKLLPFYCPTFYPPEIWDLEGEDRFTGHVREAFHAELNLVSFGYRRIETLRKEQVSPELLGAL